LPAIVTARWLRSSTPTCAFIEGRPPGSAGTGCVDEVRGPGAAGHHWARGHAGDPLFATSGACIGGTEAINGLIELHRRIARGFRNRHNYRLRMLLIGGGLSHPNLT